jgi:hypothetical protein
MLIHRFPFRSAATGTTPKPRSAEKGHAIGRGVRRSGRRLIAAHLKPEETYWYVGAHAGDGAAAFALNTNMPESEGPHEGFTCRN